MIEIRIHGRGGQGAVVASQILAKAAFLEGRYVQAFPQFGVERRGAPVLAFARVSDEPIRLRTHVYHPQHVMVLDPALMDYVDVTTGLDPQGFIVINSPLPPERFPLNETWNLASVNATVIAAHHGIGTATQPIVNTTVVGAFARVTGLVSLENLERAIAETVPGRAEANQAATREAWETVVMREASALRAEAVSR